jgi:RimJ/RimL family protein N-acetyltransferase
MNPTPVILYGDFVRLEPLDHRHAQEFLEAGQDDAIWRFMPVPRPTTEAHVVALIDKAWNAAALGHEIPFAIVDDRTDRLLGSTRFLEICRPDRALEIGWTWLSLAAQRTQANTECKFLLLRHCFEELGALRVQFRTDARNEASRRAIERIGAVKEGLLRHHRLTWDGNYRDTVYYSVLEPEWPAVKERLQAFLSRGSIVGR